MTNDLHAVKCWVAGRVQGVGFRYFVRRHAQRNGLRGYALNLDDGRVEVLLIGELGSVQAVLELVSKGPISAKVDSFASELAANVDTAKHQKFVIG